MSPKLVLAEGEATLQGAVVDIDERARTGIRHTQAERGESDSSSLAPGGIGLGRGRLRSSGFAIPGQKEQHLGICDPLSLTR